MPQNTPITVATRPAGEPVLAAFRRFLFAAGGLLAQADAGDAQALERLRTLNRVIAASPTLQAREHHALAATADALAALLAAETNAQPHDPHPQVAANALLGVQRALVAYTRQRVLADPAPTGLAADVQRYAEAAFALLDHGLGDYAPGRRPAR